MSNPSMGTLVQSCLNSIGYPDTIAGFRHMTEGRLEDSRSIYETLNTDLFFERGEEQSEVGQPKKDGQLGAWTCPRWFTAGDVSFFYHSKRAGTNAPRIYRKLQKTRIAQPDVLAGLPLAQQSAVSSWLYVLEAIARRGAEFSDAYGGKIFAIATAAGDMEVIEPTTEAHWQSTHYCGYDKVFMLDRPLDYSDFRDVVSIEQRAISNLTKTQFDYLRDSILRENPDVEFLNSIQHRDTRIHKTATTLGWRQVIAESSVQLLFESQVREYILDSFLSEVFPSPCRISKEVPCEKVNSASGIIDYLITSGSRQLAIEAKCYAIDTPELRAQLDKYCESTLKSGRFSGAVTQPRCLLIDQTKLWVFDSIACGSDQQLKPIACLSDLVDKSSVEIRRRIEEQTNE